MALRGTLGDFGIADIFQLVGHQTKTGVLLLKNRELEVRIYFVEGNVAKAEQAARDKSDLLGNMMVRGGALTSEQLEEALTTQQRTGRRLGDLLVEMGACDRTTIREFARLQTTETIYRLFTWNAGTYEFTQQKFEYDEESYEPIRAENILMEGFRMVDEWPAVKKRIPNFECTFTVLKPLPAAPASASSGDDDLLAGIDDAFAEDSGPNKKAGEYRASSAERRVFELIKPGRTAQEIIDLSRLGEFETCKALSTLAQAGFIEVHVPVLPSAVRVKRFGQGLTPRRLVEAVVPVITRVALYAVVAAAVGGVVKLWELDDSSWLARDRHLVVRRSPIVDGVGQLMRGRLVRGIEAYRLLHGRPPASLDELVASGLATERDIRFPYRDPYAYRAEGAGFSLALPMR